MATKPATAATATETTAAETVAPTTAAAAPKITVLGISADIPMPDFAKSKRGNVSKFPFAQLQVGQSFGIVGRDVKSMSSIISAQHRHKDNQRPKLDANGLPVMKKIEMAMPDGSKAMVPGTEAETEPMKIFVAVDTDPAKDPQGATVRVFRRQ